jgi:hypothetical protein
MIANCRRFELEEGAPSWRHCKLCLRDMTRKLVSFGTAAEIDFSSICFPAPQPVTRSMSKVFYDSRHCDIFAPGMHCAEKAVEL